jgi:hypothetical protein
MWEIWYENSVSVINTEAEWQAAPSTGVQVLVKREPYGAPHLSPWSHVWDRQPQTGVDEYSIPGWAGVKTGSLLSDEAYQERWRLACGR